MGAGTTLSPLPAFCRGEGGPHTPRTFKGTLGGDWCKGGLSRTTGGEDGAPERERGPTLREREGGGLKGQPLRRPGSRCSGAASIYCKVEVGALKAV